MAETLTKTAPREALEKLSRTVRHNGDCRLCEVATLPDQGELEGHADRCPVRVLVRAMMIQPAGEAPVLTLEHLSAHESRLQAVEEQTVALESRTASWDDVHRFEERVVALEDGLAAALAGGLLEQTAMGHEGRLQSIEEKIVGLEGRWTIMAAGEAELDAAELEAAALGKGRPSLELIVRRLVLGTGINGPHEGDHHEKRIDHLSNRAYALEEKTEALETAFAARWNEPEVDVDVDADEAAGFKTWPARRIAVSERAVSHLEALHPSHVMSPLFEDLVKKCRDEAEQTSKLEELQEAAESLNFIWGRLEGDDTYGRKGPYGELANALRTWLMDEMGL